MNSAVGTSFTDSQHLVIVDSASPTTPILLEVAGQWQPVAQIDEGVTDLAAGSIRNLTQRFVSYLKNSRVYRLDLRRASWPPAPAPVSALQTNDLCRFEAHVIQDRRSAERSVLVFEGVGPDRQCNTADDRLVAVRLDMSASDPPFTIEGQFLAALRAGDGAVTGFVVRSGNRVQTVDQNFENPVELFTLSSPTNRLHVIDNGERPSAPHRQLLFVDGRDVRAFSLSLGAGPATLFTLAPGEFPALEFPDRAVASDSNNVYFIVNSDRSGRLVRASDTLTAQVIASESTLHHLPGTDDPDPARFTGRRCPRVSSIGRCQRPAGRRSRSLRGQACPDLSSFFAAAESVWYDCAPLGFWDYGGWLNPPQGLPVNPIHGRVRSDGAQMEELYNLRPIATSRVNPIPLRPDAATVDTVIVASISGPGLANATLRAFDGATRSELFTYGVLPPSGFQTASGRPAASGQPALLSFGGVAANLFQTTLFFYQSDAPGLTRVTAFVP